MKTLIMILLAISVIGFATFFTVIIKKFGVLRSISASDYEFTNPWAFTAFTWWCSFPIIMIGVLGPFNHVQAILITFSGISWAIVGAAPAAKNMGMEKDVHVIGAMGACFLAYAFVGSSPYWYIIIPAIAGTLYLWIKKTSNHTWWIETIAYAVNVLGLYLFLR